MPHEKQFNSNLGVRWDNDGIEVVSKGNRVHYFDFNALASSTGSIGPKEVVLHTPSTNNERFVGVYGIGKNNDIYYLMHLVPSGQGEWIVDSDKGSHLRCYDCGVKGLRTNLSFNEGIATITFGVANPPCRISIRHENGQWKVDDQRGFCR